MNKIAFYSAWTRKRVLWTAAGILAVGINMGFSAWPNIAESVYGQGVYPVIRIAFRYSLGLLPFPAVTLVAVFAGILLWRTCLHPLIRRRVKPWTFLAGFISTIGAILCLFQLLWGFNYTRDDLALRMGLNTEGMYAEDLRAEYFRATAELKAEAYALGSVSGLNTWESADFEDAVEPILHDVIREAGYPNVASPRARLVGPRGLLMRWNTAGIYVPFSGEGHVDAGMLPVQVPFTLAHEMGHGFGVTDEGDCNFLGYLVCKRSDDPLVRFSGLLTYWRYVASEYRRTFPEEYAESYERLPILVRETLAAIRANDALYPDLFPRVRNAVYDSYLKTQGIPEGLQSYYRIVQLVWAYEQLSHQTPEKN
jgi:hypothetical protein